MIFAGESELDSLWKEGMEQNWGLFLLTDATLRLEEKQEDTPERIVFAIEEAAAALWDLKKLGELG